MKSKLLRWISLSVVLGLFISLSACQPPAAPTESGPAPETVTPVEVPRDGVFLHISHGPQHAHRVLMGLRMAEMMMADRDVLVYFDVNGVDVVLEGTNIESEGFPSSAEILAGLIDGGAEVYVCPTCLEKAGKTADELMDGVQMADPDSFFDFTEGRILTLDY